MCKIIFVGVLLLFFNNLYSQNVEIKGRVTDSKTKTPLKSISVQIGKSGVQTDSNGLFKISIDKLILKENDIYITSIGYKKQIIRYNANKFLNIELESENTSLDEVIISSNAENLIKKAISNIPKNFSQNKFILNGILRIYRTEIDSPKCYKYFKSDAVLKVLYPPYTSDSKKPQVSVVQNKTIFLEPYQADYDQNTWVNGYQVNDFVNKKETFIDIENLQNFKYINRGKTTYHSHKVWVIAFNSKRKNYCDGIMYIDTASYAFIYANFTYYNVRRLFFKTIEKSNSIVSYENIGTKWYLNTFNKKTSYFSKKAKLEANNDFIATSVDTVNNFTELDKKKLVHNLDEDLKVLRPTSDSNWIIYYTIFAKAQSENRITFKPLPASKNLQVKKEKVIIDEDDIPFNKRMSFLNETKLKLSFSLETINIKSNSYSKGALGGGFGISFKIANNVYAKMATTFNFRDNNKILTTSEGLLINYSINLKSTLHPLYIKPFIGYTFVQLADEEDYVLHANEITLGIGISYPIIPKISPFINFAYNKLTKTKGKLENYYFTPSTISIGFDFSF